MMIGGRAVQPSTKTDGFADPDLAIDHLERRWFAAAAAVKSLQAECDVLLEVVHLAEDAWGCAYAKLSRLEELRDALGDRLAARDSAMPREVSAA